MVNSMHKENYTELSVNVFVQARMSSQRFPGKVLAPLGGKPILMHVLERIMHVMPKEKIIVLTSELTSDDPLVCYAGWLGFKVFRGNLNDVFSRFRACLQRYPCEWFFRISADSPVLDVNVMKRMLNYIQAPAYDMITNVFPRTYPRGKSAELIWTPRFLQIDPNQLSDEEKEHVTKVYYNHPQDFRILNLEAENPITNHPHLAIDTIEDLRFVEQWLCSEEAKD